MSGGGYPQYPPAYSPPTPSGLPYGPPSQSYGGSQYPAPPPNYSQLPYGPPPQGYEPPPAYAPPGHQQFAGVFGALQPQRHGEGFSVEQQQGGPMQPAAQNYGAPSSSSMGYTPNTPQQHLYPTLPPHVPPPPQGYGSNFESLVGEKSRQGGPVPQRPAPPPPHLPSAPPTIGFGITSEYSTGDTSGRPPQGGPAPFELPAGFAAPFSPPQPLGPWKDTPLPPFLREAWQCGSSTRVYLLQHDGMIVAPNANTFLRVHLNTEFDYGACPSRRGSLSTRPPSRSPSGRNSPALGVQSPTSSPGGSLSPQTPPHQQYSMVAECPGVCRVKLSPAHGHVLVTSARDYIAIVDQGTNPCRSVVVALPHDLDQTHLQKLLTLLESNGSLTTENGGVVTTVTSSVESAFNYSSKYGCDLLKDKAPDLYKSTRVIRKGTGALVRLGGSLVSKGAFLVAETVSPTSKEDKMAQYDPLVNQLKAAVAAVKDHLSRGSITYVSPPRGL